MPPPSPPLALGLPAKISTVDKYQGQQNDFVLLSLVKTKNVGHVRIYCPVPSIDKCRPIWTRIAPPLVRISTTFPGCAQP